MRAQPTGPKKGERNLKPQVAVMARFETKMSPSRFEQLKQFIVHGS
jgi:hypothetical protein